MTHPTRIIAWNICQGGNPRIPKLIAAIASLAPEILVLSEVRSHTVGQWIAALREVGLAHQTNGVAAVSDAEPYGVLIASTSPHEPQQWTKPCPAPNRAVRVIIDGLSVTGVHAPADRAHAAPFYSWLASEAVPCLSRDAVLVGDFNADVSGDGVVLAPLFSELVETGWTHGLRHHDPAGEHHSWWSPVRGFSIDHCLLSPTAAKRLQRAIVLGEIAGQATAGSGLSPTRDALSDHRPILVELGS